MSSFVSDALRPFGTTIFTTMSRLAAEKGAVNLAQGFPDFDGPEFIREAAARALRDEPNQYAPMPGLASLRAAVGERFTRDTGIHIDADSEVTVTTGATGALAAALLGLCNPGDEVVLFEPFYDAYRACVAMAGATARTVALRPPAGDDAAPAGRPADAPGATGAGGPGRAGRVVHGSFTIDEGELWAAFGPRTRVVLVNTPHNPTGKVFTLRELQLIADLCLKHDAVAVVDEVYERLLFEPRHSPHVALASLPGMSKRTLTLSSLGKTFSLTGWKIGWAVGAAPLTAALRAAHQFLAFSVATPLQHGAVAALRKEGECVPGLVGHLRAQRDRLAPVLAELGMDAFLPPAGYFLCADHTRLPAAEGGGDDRALCTRLIEGAGVAAIPPSVFYARPELGRGMLRFAFCKRAETMTEGLARLRRFAAGRA